MQKLKQGNLGQNLRLGRADLVYAQGPALPQRSTIRRVRIRIEIGGYGERSYHEIDRNFSVFTHHDRQLDQDQLTEVMIELRRAFAERSVVEDDADPNGVYRTIHFRDDGRVHEIYAEYAHGPILPSFETAWTLLDQMFPIQPDA